MPSVVWGYYLGLWLIGLFPSEYDCQQARQYQVAQGVQNVGSCSVQVAPAPFQGRLHTGR